MTFDVSVEDEILIDKIVCRARDAYRIIDRLRLSMDLQAVHANSKPLDLQRLLESRDEDFSHDIFGIMSNVNRETGKLENGFAPRHSL